MKNPIPRSIWLKGDVVEVLDQRWLPHEERNFTVDSTATAAEAIAEMVVRGAPLIGITAAFGMALQSKEEEGEAAYRLAARKLESTRPTAVNLSWACQQQLAVAAACNWKDCGEKLWQNAIKLMEEDAENCREIGRHALPLIEKIYEQKGETVNILTHCNAGSLACIEWGTATSPLYQAHLKGIPIHVWVDETRPRLQGAQLTAYELAKAGIPHSIITDNAGGHYMQKGMVDLAFTGADRISLNGDAANKIGTYLKALAARDNNVPFYVLFPLSTIDSSIEDGLREIEIEERDGAEIHFIQGKLSDGSITRLRISPEGSAAGNPGFDVTPARLISGLISEKGCFDASKSGVEKMLKEASNG